jgi:hypothetical protein
LAYRIAEAAGIPLWCQDEAGPYQAVPQPGQSWQPEGHPRCQPHEYIRGGTAKLLTLFRPATGEVRATGVPSAPNAVLHPWLQHELLQVLAEVPEVASAGTELPLAAQWATWLEQVPHLPLPPLRLIPAQCNTPNDSGMRFQAGEQAPANCVPQPHRCVVSARGHNSPVSTER